MLRQALPRTVTAVTGRTVPAVVPLLIRNANAAICTASRPMSSSTSAGAKYPLLRNTGFVRVRSSALMHTIPNINEYKFILAEKKDKVGIITLNRPKYLNALCDELVQELNKQLLAFDADHEVGCIVITGSGNAFAAGADIKEMSDKTFMTAYRNQMLAFWHDATHIRKPIIAAVNGHALGGGCELAMMCDTIIASDKAQFGQPEVLLGTIPGCGGTQRLTRAVGKAKAMEMILSGVSLTAAEAEKCGLVARVVPADQLMEKTMDLARKIAGLSQPIVAMAKEAVNAAYETTLQQGVVHERHLFYATFASHDQKEGMKAFLEKPRRKPDFKHE